MARHPPQRALSACAAIVVGMALWQKIVVLLLASAIGGSGVYFTRLVLRPRSVPQAPWVSYVHPNVEKLRAAQELHNAGRLPEARALLAEALVSAPRSPVTRELRDLLGQINTQLFFAREPSVRKTEYTVARGDALSSIARKLASSTDAIMRVNGLASTLLRPGDKLIVPRLEFTITVDLPRERVVVHDGHGFFTQYAIAAIDLPKTRAAQVQTKVSAKSFWEDGKPVARTRGADPQAGTPWIYLRRGGYVLYGVDETSDDGDSKIEIEGDGDAGSPDAEGRPPQGIAILKRDIVDLELLISKGTPVTVILSRE